MPVHEHGERAYDWVGSISERRAALTPETIGVIDATTGTEYSYARLDARANRTARLLTAAGVSAGDRVAVISRNRPELVDLYFATGKVGAVLAPLSHRLAPPELAALLDTVDPSLLIVEPPTAGSVAEALEHEAIGDAEPPVMALATNDERVDLDWQSYDAALPANDSPVESVQSSLNDPHLFLHTGGSTGLPKEVILTHGSIAWNAFTTIISWGLRPDDLTPMVFPLFHTGGWNVLTVPLFHLGGTVVIARDFDPGGVLRVIEEREATVFVGVPAVLRFMVEHADWEATDLSSLRFVKSGGGPCRATIIDAWSDRGIELTQGYGLTECGPNNFAMPAPHAGEKPESIGVPGLYVDARVVDETGQPVGTETVGELELASPQAAAGYWENQEETAITFGDGWVSTGDLARVDEDGSYYIVGRKKNMFVSGGENVYPPEVEAVISEHPGVDEVVVVPVPDETWGQVGKAVVEGDQSLSLADLQEFLDGRLARFKVPKHLAFVDQMPMSGPSKIDRQTIEEEYGEESEVGAGPNS